MRKILITSVTVILVIFCTMNLSAKNQTCGETVSCFFKCPTGAAGATCQKECIDDSTPNSKSKFKKFDQCSNSPQVSLCLMDKKEGLESLLDCLAQHCIQEMQGCFGIKKDYFDLELSMAKCLDTVGIFNKNVCGIFAKSLSTKNALKQEEDYLSCRNQCKTEFSNCNAQFSCWNARCNSRYPNKLSENRPFSKSDNLIITKHEECMLQYCSSESNVFLHKICGIANNCYSKIPKTKGSVADFPFSNSDYPNSCTQIASEISSLSYPTFEKTEQKSNNLPTETIKLINLINFNRADIQNNCVSWDNKPQNFTDVFSTLSDAQGKYEIMLLPLYNCYRRNLKETGLMNNDYSIDFISLSEETKTMLLERCNQEISECENSLNKYKKAKKQ